MPKVTSVVSRVAMANQVSLVQGQDYEVIGIDETYFRIVDESGDPVLYPKSYFIDCEVVPPDDWKYRDFGNGVYSYDPPEFASTVFFEDYHDGQPTAVQRFRIYLENIHNLNRE